MSILAEPPVAIVDKVVDKKRDPRRRRRVSAVPVFAGGPGARREAPLPAARSEGRREICRHLRPGEALHHRRGVRWLAERAESPLRRRRDVRSDLPPGTMKKTVLPGFRLTMGFTIFYLCLIVILPLLTLPARSATMTWDAFWQTISDPRVVASYRLSIGASLGRRGHQRGVRADRGVGAGALHVPGAADRRFAGRSAVRAADRGRRHHADRDLRAQRLDGAAARALRREGGLHPARDHDGAGLHRPAVRGPDAAAGDRGSGCRKWKRPPRASAPPGSA